MSNSWSQYEAPEYMYEASLVEWHDVTPYTTATLEETIAFDSFTVNTALLELGDALLEQYQSSDVHVFMFKETAWKLLYISQGKRYPSPRKRKSQARMSRKWRGRA